MKVLGAGYRRRWSYDEKVRLVEAICKLARRCAACVGVRWLRATSKTSVTKSLMDSHVFRTFNLIHGQIAGVL